MELHTAQRVSGAAKIEYRYDMIEDAVVRAKAEYATQMAMANGMEYVMISGRDAMRGVGIS